MRHVLIVGACLVLMLSFGSAQTPAPKGTIYVFRRSYAPGNKPSVILDGTRIARMQSGSYFSIPVDSGTHRLQSSLNPDGEMTDIDVPPGQTVYIEMTFADVPHQGGTFSRGQWLKTPLFTATPGSVARDRFPKLKPLDQKWAFDQRVEMAKPDFP